MDAHPADQVEAAHDDKDRSVAEVLDDEAGDEGREDDAADAAEEAAESGDGGDGGFREDVGDRGVEVGGPALMGGGGQRNERDSHPGFRHDDGSGGNRHAEGEDAHDELARPAVGPAAADEEAAEPAAEDAAEVGHQIDDRQRPADLLEAQTAGFLEIQRQPDKVEPPDRIGEEFGEEVVLIAYKRDNPEGSWH